MQRVKRLLPWIVCSLLLCATSGAQAKKEAKDWRTSAPEAQGIDSAQLAEAIETATRRVPGIHSLLVVRNGVLAAETYFHPYDGTQPHDLASVTKSVTTTLAGIAIARGRIKSSREPMLSFFPGEKAANGDERKTRVRLDHLMTMSSGLDCKAQRGEPTLWEMLAAPDNVRHMLDLSMVAEPGANFVYCSGGMHLLSAIVARATGVKTEAFARQALFAPIGIGPVIWPPDPQGVNHGFGNLHMRPRDMARLGQLVLNRGAWEGRRIVPAEWIAEATRSQKTTGNARDYGYGWWIPKSDNPIAFEASGRGGQQISLLPAKNALIVLNGGGFATGEVMKLVLPAIKSDASLPANPAGLARLRAAIAAAARPPAPTAPANLPEIARTVSGKRYTLETNWMGLKQLTLTFADAKTATAQLVFGPAPKQSQFGRAAKIQGQTTLAETRAIGLDGVPRIGANGPMGLPVALRGAWEDPQTFALEYDEIANINCYRLRIAFTETGVRIQAKERTGLFDETFSGTASN